MLLPHGNAPCLRPLTNRRATPTELPHGIGPNAARTTWKVLNAFCRASCLGGLQLHESQTWLAPFPSALLLPNLGALATGTGISHHRTNTAVTENTSPISGKKSTLCFQCELPNGSLTQSFPRWRRPGPVPRPRVNG